MPRLLRLALVLSLFTALFFACAWPARSSPAATEWTFHKSADGSHPDGREQQMVWLMNRARAAPAVEGTWLANSTIPDIAGGRDYFQVVKSVLTGEFNGYPAKAPAAFDVRLYNAARVHSDDLIARNAQDHNNQFTQVTAAGFVFTAARGNVFSYADSALNAHAAFNIDWGGTPPPSGDGMQAGRGHRMAIMSLDGAYTNVGVAVVADTNPGATVGPYVVTGNYCAAATSNPNHYNNFIVGTVWQDLNHNALYDPGEGIGGVTVTPASGTYYAVSGAAGGYAIPVTMAAGTVNVTFSGAGISATRPVTVGATSVLLDYLKSTVTLTARAYVAFVNQ